MIIYGTEFLYQLATVLGDAASEAVNKGSNYATSDFANKFGNNIKY